MAEYYAVLSKAVAGLTESADARRKVYDKARNALIGQLKAINPPLQAQEISRQRLELEEAIRRVEREASAAARTAAPRAPRRESVAPQPERPSPDDMFRRAVGDAGAAERMAAEMPQRRASQDWASPRAPRPSPAPPPPEPAYAPPEPAYTAPPQPEPVYAPPPQQPTFTQPEPQPVYTQPEPQPAYHQPQPRPVHDQPPQPETTYHQAPQPDPAPFPRGELPQQEAWHQPEPAPRPPDPGYPPRQPQPYPQQPTVSPQPPASPEISVGRAGVSGFSATVAPDAPPREWHDEPPEEPRRVGRPPEPATFARKDDFWDGAEDDRREPAWSSDDGRATPAGVVADPFDADDNLDDNPRHGRHRDHDLLDEPARRSRWPAVLLSGLLILLIGGLGALAWLQRDRIEDLIAVFDAQGEPPPQTSEPREGGFSEPAKIADRLLSGDDGPGGATIVDGVRQVGPGADLATLPQATTTGTTPPGSGVAGLPQLPDAGAAGGQAGAPQSAMLYEEPLNAETPGEGVVAIAAQVAWRFVPSSGPTGDQVVADIQVPERGIDIGLTIWKNGDDSLPASHLVEVTVRSANIPITQVPRLVLKSSESGRRQPLIGASAKVDESIFWIALSNNPNDVNFNIDQFRRMGWIDLPLVYANGQRAIITIQKGDPGREAINQALASWARN